MKTWLDEVNVTVRFFRCGSKPSFWFVFVYRDGLGDGGLPWVGGRVEGP